MGTQIGAISRSKNSKLSSPNLLRGSRAILNFGASKRGNSFIYSFDHEENVDELMDEYFNQPEKKRRLSIDQVKFLEKCFVEDNKLEPDRKIQIAKELGLEPRQITIWFQNRRARWKSRQLETDYEALNRNYERLKTDYDNLFNDHEKLKAEILCLKTNGVLALHPLRNVASSFTSISCDANEYDVSQVSTMNSWNESSKSSDATYAESLLFAASGLSSYELGLDHTNTIPNHEDEFTGSDYIFSKVEVSQYLPNGDGFYLEFPTGDTSWSD